MFLKWNWMGEMCYNCIVVIAGSMQQRSLLDSSSCTLMESFTGEYKQVHIEQKNRSPIK